MIRVYGASDDLIEVEGDIREEFAPVDGLPSVLAFSDGSVLEVRYDSDGVWRITQRIRGSADYSHQQAPADDERNYSDIATLDGGGPIRWVLFAGTSWQAIQA